MSDRSFTSASFYALLREKRLMAARCARCGKLHLPPRPLCDRCQSASMEWTQLSGRGKVVAFTAIAVVPSFMVREGYDRGRPYCSGIVETEEGPRISARILGVDASRPKSIAIGSPAAIEFLQDEHGATRPVVAFRVQP